MKNTRKGFTLIEILVTIILLGIVGSIIIYNVAKVQTASKEENQKKYEAAIQSAASVYADENPDAFNELHVSKAFIYIKAGDLIDAGYLSGDLVNPQTGLPIGRNELVKVSLDSASGGLIFTYPVVEDEEETFLVGLDEWVVWGEPYDCFHGAGTYSFALSDEAGNLIDLSNADNIKKYHLTCEYPSGWTQVKDADKASLGLPNDGKSYYRYAPNNDKNGGTFRIKYSWLSESGVRKEATRNIVVQSKVVARLSGVEMMGGNTTGTAVTQGIGANLDNGDVNNRYTPKYVNGKWRYLGLVVDIDGADKQTTTYTIMKTTWGQNSDYFDGDPTVRANRTKFRNVETNAAINVTKNGTTVVPQGLTPSGDFTKIFTADDGKIEYYITTTVKGHFTNGYKYDSQDKVRTYVELYLDDDFITLSKAGENGEWLMNKEVTIYHPYSPVGIWGYYVELVDDTNKNKNPEIFVSKHSTNPKVNTLGTSYANRVEILTHNYTLSASTSILSKYNASKENTQNTNCDTAVYSKIKVKPINENGFLGTASSGSNLQVTNRFGLLIAKTANSNASCQTGCGNVTALPADYQTYLNSKSKNETSGSSAYNKAVASTKFMMNGLNCYYCKDSTAIYFRPSAYRYPSQSDPTLYLYNLLGIYKNGASSENAQKWNYLITPVKYMTDTRSSTISHRGLYSLASLSKGTWTINTCDGTYSTGYDMISPTFRENALKYITNYNATTVDPNWSKFFERVQCKATVGADYSARTAALLPAQSWQWGNLTQEWIQKGQEALARYNNLLDEISKNSSYRYDSQYCLPNLQDFNIFSTALFRSDDPRTYWLAATRGEQKVIRVAHGDQTSIYNTFYYARLAGNALHERYYADPAYLKPMMKLKNVDCVLSGKGQYNNPYILSMNKN